MAITVSGLQGNARLSDAASKRPLELPSWHTTEGVHLFGIRHLSPAGSWHLEHYLETVQPELILIEGPSDATDFIPDITRKDIVAPFALMSYTAQPPIHSLLFPFAVYSPEYRAMLWARKQQVPCRFIDLPASIKLPLTRLEDLERVNRTPSAEDQFSPNDLYQKLVEASGEASYDTYWERHFEHTLAPGAYASAVSLFSTQMRELTEGGKGETDPVDAAINTLRETHMKRLIIQALEEGFDADKIVVVCGAYHVAGLMNCVGLSDDELLALPEVETRITLMPYSYYKLSSFSGYGAGNHAPRYFEMLWQAMSEGRIDSVPIRYLTEVTSHMRERHGSASTATALEAVRLAQGLQALHDGLLPTLDDLHEAAVATIAEGRPAYVAEAFARVDVGTQIGSLPDGVSQTSIQDDMTRNLKELKLEPYRSVVAQDLVLDLRENLRVKSKKSAFLDLNRSFFFHRLAQIGIDFARAGKSKQERATWAEPWVVRWIPETEVQLVESVLLGDTVEAAATFALRERLLATEDIAEVAQLIQAACACNLPPLLADATAQLAALSTECGDFNAIGHAARDISFLLQYGSLRGIDTDAFLPLLEQLFLKASLLLVSSATGDDEAALRMTDTMSQLHYITQENADAVDDDLWLAQLGVLAHHDNRNPLLCGFAFSLLLERRQVSDDELHIQMSRYLSPGTTTYTGASWFEGLVLRNRYFLLSHLALWRQLDIYLAGLDEEGFVRALVCLRRSFSAFQPHEKAGICEVLADIWGIEQGALSEFLQNELNEQEQTALDELNDFDFGDLT